MRAMLYMIVVLFIFLSSSMAERKVLDRKHRKIIPGATEIYVPKRNGKKGHDLIIKNHDVTYNAKTGLYIYRYWETDSTYVDLLYEPSNRLDVTVACTVSYDAEADEYTYTYHLTNNKNSVQPLGTFVLDIDRSLVLRTETPDPWYYFSTDEPPPGSPRWVFWGDLGGPVPPGESISLRLVSKHGPVIATCYSKGRAQTFDHPDQPDLVIDALAVYPSNIEGITGKTLAPGAWEAGDARVRLMAFLKVAQTWGWISPAKRVWALGYLSKRLDKAAFTALRNELQEVREGEVESEVPAFLAHFGRKQGFVNQ